jgi:hypothetical protein
MASLPHKSPSLRQGQLVLAATRSLNSLQNLVETIVRPTNVKSSVSRGRMAGALPGVVGGLLSLAAALAGQYTGATLWCGAVFACLCHFSACSHCELTSPSHRLPSFSRQLSAWCSARWASQSSCSSPWPGEHWHCLLVSHNRKLSGRQQLTALANKLTRIA